MLTSAPKFSIFQGIKKYRIRRVIFIALFWTLIDSITTILNYNATQNHTKSIITRELLVFLMSGIMGYLFVYTLRNIFKDRPILINFFAKTFILLFAALISILITGFAYVRIKRDMNTRLALQLEEEKKYDPAFPPEQLHCALS